MKKLIPVLIILGILIWALKTYQKNTWADKNESHTAFPGADKKKDQQGAAIKLPGYRIMKSISIY